MRILRTAVLSLVVAAPSAHAAFLDVPADHPNAIAIEYLNRNGIVQGYPNGTFDPQRAVNRAEIMKMMVEGQGITPDVNEYRDCFPDVTTEWFAKYVCYARERGWVGGYPDGTFRPGQTVADVEALKMILNARGITIDDVDRQPFRDIAVNDWFAPYVATAKRLNLLEETEANFGPGKAMTRAGTAENIFRAITIAEADIPRFDAAAALAIKDMPMMRADGTRVIFSSSSESSQQSTPGTLISDAPLVDPPPTSSASSQSSAQSSSETPPPVAVAAEPATFAAGDGSELSFTGGREGVPIHDGRFGQFTFSMTVPSGNAKNADDASINMTIDITSLETDTSGLTSHLLSADFFEAETFPEATFISTSVSKQAGTVYLVSGELTIKGVTRFVTLPVNIDHESLALTYQLNRIDFGVGTPDDGIDQVIPLELIVRLRRS